MATKESSQEVNWEKAHHQDFWAEIAPTDHLVQVYASDEVFINTLRGYVVSGIIAGESIILIATHEHLKKLKSILLEQGFDLQKLRKEGRYQDLDADKVLSKFMVKGWPNEELFYKSVNQIISTAKKHNPATKIRAFGEMVALLWEKGNYGATVHLEHLWNKFCKTQAFCLYCAYPKAGFTKDPIQSLQNICGLHHKMISGTHDPTEHIHYQHTVKK